MEFLQLTAISSGLGETGISIAQLNNQSTLRGAVDKKFRTPKR
jgi:hypothetical protein